MMEAQAGPPKMPGWVKVVGIVMGVVLLIVLAAFAFGGGKHGPSRHLSGDSTDDRGHGPPNQSTPGHAVATDAPSALDTGHEELVSPATRMASNAAAWMP